MFFVTITEAQTQLSLKTTLSHQKVPVPVVYLGNAPDCTILVQLEIDTNSNAFHHKSWERHNLSGKWKEMTKHSLIVK